MRRVRLGIALGCVAACTAIGAAPAAAGPFAPDSYVNQPLPDNAPLDPSSSTMVAELDVQVQSQLANPDVTKRPAVDYYWCSPRVYTVPAGQATVPVTVVGPSSGDATLRQQFAAVPIPPGAKANEQCADHNLLIYQPDTDKLWEFWIAAQDAQGNWSAYYGGEIGPEQTGMLGVNENPGYWTNPPTGFGAGYGATATSLPMLAGLQRISELQAGAINHSVSFAMQAPAACYRFPAQRQDGNTSSSNPLAPPEGAILRLPASLNVDSLNLPKYDAILAKAVQRYGMVVRDRASQTVFYAEKPIDDTTDPYNGPGGIFDGWSTDALMSKFPWDKLQVLAVAPGHSPCQT